jgi:uncharacterized repeat protein (TIGR01451 family)
VFAWIEPAFVSGEIGGNAEVNRYRNQMYLGLPSGNADVNRYRNQMYLGLPSGNADVNRYRNLALMQLPETTDVSSIENSFQESTFIDTLTSQKAIIKNVTISGDLSGVLNFTNFELVTISSGSFSGKGFSKGDWQATIEGAKYEGEWNGVLFLKSSERRIYLEGATSGDIVGTMEGYLTESTPQSGNYNHYQVTWKIGNVLGSVISATVNLDGVINYQSTSQFPTAGFRLLQASFAGKILRQYNCSLNTVITQVCVVNGTNYNGKGFSIISYTSDYGAGEGWAYDQSATDIVQMNGISTGSLFGVLQATIYEATSPRLLGIVVERVDLGSPPAEDLKVTIWGPQRVSPGQTVNYIIEYQNEGLKPAQDVPIVLTLPSQAKYVSCTGGGSYISGAREVEWWISVVPVKSSDYLSVQTIIEWGLPSGSLINPFVNLPLDRWVPLQDSNINYQILDATNDPIRLEILASKQGVSSTMTMDGVVASVSEPVEPSLTYVSNSNGERIDLVFSKDATLDTTRYSLTLKTNNPIWGAIQPEEYATSARYQNYLDWLNEKKLIEPESYKIQTEYNNARAAVAFFIDHSEHVVRDSFFGPAISGYLQLGRELLYNGIEAQLYSEITKNIPEAMNEGRLPQWIASSLDVRKLFLQDSSKGFGSTTSEVILARDPNIKYGPEGYVSSGQKLNYTVEFENEGEGIAYGVYFADTLDKNLNDSTLQIDSVRSKADGSIIAPPGTYNPSTRTITWLVGEVGSKQGGYSNFSVQVENGLPKYTEIINYATVYFPSVPETTRTNGIVSVVGSPNLVVLNLTSNFLMDRGSNNTVLVTVANEGCFPENFNLTLYANNTLVQTQNVTLSGKSKGDFSFVWSTANFALGNYTVSAYSSPVLYETQTDDNLLQTNVALQQPPSLVVRGRDNEIFYKDFYTLSGEWGGWKALPSGSTPNSPASVACLGKLYFVVRGMDNTSLWFSSVNQTDSSFSGWTYLGGSTPSTPTLTSNDTHLCLVIRGQENAIYYRLFDVALDSWSGWYALPSGTTLDRPAATILNSKLHIVVRGMDGLSIWHCTMDLSTRVFSGWTKINGESPSAPTLAVSKDRGEVYLLVRGADNAIYHNTWNATGWSGWASLSTGSTLDAPAAVVVGDKLEIVVRGMESTTLWHSTLNLTNDEFSGWTWTSGSTPSIPILIG